MQKAEIDKLATAILDGNRRALSKGITLVESNHADHRESANLLLEQLMPATGNSVRVGITGVPGVGKSTFIEAFGQHAIKQGNKVAVLAIDPSSSISGGSILGDKTRMEVLSRHPDAFIRPSPAGTTLGGVARRTRETLLLCEAAGFDFIVVETVGVGQSETLASEMTDMFLLLLLPGGGDELQGMKRGITELADLILVNKADGDQAKTANHTVSDYRSAIQFLSHKHQSWSPRVETCSATTGKGIEQAWALVNEFKESLQHSGEWQQRRSQQALSWMWREISDLLVSDLRQHPILDKALPDIQSAVTQGIKSPTFAALEIVTLYKQTLDTSIS